MSDATRRASQPPLPRRFHQPLRQGAWSPGGSRSQTRRLQWSLAHCGILWCQGDWGWNEFSHESIHWVFGIRQDIYLGRSVFVWWLVPGLKGLGEQRPWPWEIIYINLYYMYMYIYIFILPLSMGGCHCDHIRSLSPWHDFLHISDADHDLDAPKDHWL